MAAQHDGTEEEDVNFKEAIMDTPIVGVEQGEIQGPTARPIKSPKPMTQAEKEVHDLTHQPPHSGCSICASNRTPNLQH